MGRYAGTRNSLLLTVLAGICSGQQVSVLDVQNVPAVGDPLGAVVAVHVPDRPPEIRCDVLVVGAGMGGVGAALSASERGHSVCLTEETDWIGGQATAGGVSALDENRFIEFAGGTRSYYAFREGIRNVYRRSYSLKEPGWENLNPGSCYVSALCFEPKVGEQVLRGMLSSSKIRLLPRTKVFSLERQGARIHSALAWQFDRREVVRIIPRFVLDATETGELLPLAKVPYIVGSEAKSDTREPDAAAKPDPGCVQSFTYPFAIERRDGEEHRVAKLPDYETIVKRQDFTLRMNYPVQYGWKGIVQYRMFGEDPPVPNNMSPGPFFAWRRLLAAENFTGGVPHDVALMNWPRQDYAAESPLDKSPAETARILQRAKQTSLAFLYWLQNDLARDDGPGKGYPELLLRPDVMQTADGLSKFPYIRESMRIVARGRVVEQDIVDAFQPGPRARPFADSVGVGFYMVDIHPCGANEHGHMMMPRPFQIPLATLLPKDQIENFLPAGKNIGVTHLTNGAFRLHPIEWNVGEAAGMFASLQLESGSSPATAALQHELARKGVPLVWFDDLHPGHPAFAAIQESAIRGVYPLDASGLHASPESPVTRAEAAAALFAFFGRKAKDPLAEAVSHGWMAADHRNWRHGDLPFYWTDWRESTFPRALPKLHTNRTGPVRRAELAQRFYPN